MLKMQGQLQHTQLILNLVMTQEVASINMLTSLLVLTHIWSSQLQMVLFLHLLTLTEEKNWELAIGKFFNAKIQAV